MLTAKFKYELGMKAKDIINGFSGIITARAEHVTGCNRYVIFPDRLTKDGDIIDGKWCDEDSIEIIGKKPVIEKIIPAGPSAG